MDSFRFTQDHRDKASKKAIVIDSNINRTWMSLKFDRIVGDKGRYRSWEGLDKTAVSIKKKV